MDWRDFWDELTTQRVVTNDDALHGLLLVVAPELVEANYAARLDAARKRGGIGEDADLPPTESARVGMIALAGIIVRNSILLVDFINKETAAGVPFEQAVIHSGAVRAKPIMLTALAAMIGGLFIIDDPIFNGLAISLIFGIMISTLLTLVVIPVLYYAVMKNKFS